MRHGVKLNPLGRKKAHRKALMRNLTRQLIEHKRIITTVAKAKALRMHVEPILTKAKTDNMHNRRVVFSYVQDKETIKELFGNIGGKIANRPGGYCRIIKMQRRQGDSAEMAMIELVDYNETYDTTTEVGTKKKRTRRGRSKTSAKKAAAPAAESAEVASETTAVEEAPAVEETSAAVEETPEVVKEAPVAEKAAEVVEEAFVVEETPEVAETPKAAEEAPEEKKEEKKEDGEDEALA